MHQHVTLLHLLVVLGYSRLLWLPFCRRQTMAALVGLLTI